MTDLDGRRVLDVVAGRDTAQAVALWESLPGEQRVKVEAAAMDMGANFVAATRTAAPQAVIVHDRFHVSQHLNQAVDKTRREGARRLEEKGDETLKQTRWLCLCPQIEATSPLDRRGNRTQVEPWLKPRPRQ